MDYFALFGLPVSYPVDLNQLSQRYQELQRQYHPDRFAIASDSEKLQALQRAATINDAYQTLKHPLKRAEYLLSLQGEQLSEQQTFQDPQFLLEQLELREELDTLVRRPNSLDALMDFTAKVSAMSLQQQQQLEQLLGAGEWSAAADIARKLHFFDKLQQQIAQFEEQLLDL